MGKTNQEQAITKKARKDEFVVCFRINQKELFSWVCLSVRPQAR